MPGEGRSFRRKTSQFWTLWPLSPQIEEARRVVYVDGIHLRRNCVVLICCDDTHVLGWYLCRYEHKNAWVALMERIAEPQFVVSDGGSGFSSALRDIWPHAFHQRCVFHVFSQIKRYTTTRPQILAGQELYQLSKSLLYVKTPLAANQWIEQFQMWLKQHEAFLKEKKETNMEDHTTHMSV